MELPEQTTKPSLADVHYLYSIYTVHGREESCCNYRSLFSIRRHDERRKWREQGGSPREGSPVGEDL